MNEDDFESDELDLIDQFTDCIKADKNNKDLIIMDNFGERNLNLSKNLK